MLHLPATRLACRPIASSFVFAFLALCRFAEGAAKYFDTGTGNNLTAGSATWDTGTTAAWAASAAPGVSAPGTWAAGSDAFFQTAGTNTVAISGTVSAFTLTQTTSGTITTISGGILSLGNGTSGSLTNSGNSALTINSPLTLNGALTVNAASPVALGGGVSGAFALTKTGSGALTLSGNSSYSGITTVSAGALRLGGASNAGLGTGTVVIGSGGTILNNDATARSAANTLQIGNANTGDTSVFTIAAGGDLTFGALTLETQNHRTLTVSNGVTSITGNLTHGNRFLTKAGTGALIIRGTSDAVAGGGMAITGGMGAIAGVSGGQNATEELKLFGGVFGANGTYVRGLGAGNGQVQWADRAEANNATASGGFAAFGLNATWGNAANNLSVNLGGASATMTWASTANFVSGGSLLLGHTVSNGTVTVLNPLNLNVKPRTVNVTRSTIVGAGTDAALAGTVSGGILVKSGTGILALTAASNSASRVSVTQGTLAVTAPSIADTSDIWLSTGATLDLPHGSTDTIDQLVINNVVQATGTWGSLASSATNKSAQITGSGMLLVSRNAATTEAPIIENLAASSITTLAATLNSTLLANGLTNPSVKIYYGTVDGGTTVGAWQNVVDLGAVSTVNPSAAVSGLQAFTQYYFRAFAQNAEGSDWADTTSTFSTLVAFHINEVLAVNTTGKKDEDLSFQPWIEIWNPSRVSKFSLAGYKLTHGATQWTLPAVDIMPDERMLIFASGKNRSVVTSWLHTNFALNPAGGTLTLTQPGGTVDSAITYPALTANTSFGRDFADLAATGLYASPTPEEGNNYSGAGVSGNVAVSLSSRAFTTPQSVSLTKAVPVAGAVIRYTLDGSTPVSSSPEYSVPLTIGATTLLRARVFEPGKLPGETESAGYLLLDGTTSAFNTAAPIVVVSNFGLGTLPDAVDQPVFMWVWQQGLDGRARLSNLPSLAGRGVADRRGSSTLGNAKTNFNFEARKARDEDDNDISLLGMPAGSDWVFHAPFAFDRSDLHNPFFYALSNSIGREAMETRMAEVFVETSGGSLNFSGGASGDYFGVYNVMEKIRRDKDRISVAKLDTYDNDAVGKTGGFIWKVDRLDAGDTGFAAGGQTMAYYYPKEVDVKSPQRDPQEQYLTSYINSFKTALDGVNYTNPATGYAAWLDVGAAIDHHLMNVWTFNVDGLRLSGFLHKERGGKITFGPVWDVDRGLSSTDGRDANPATWRSQTGDFGTDFFNYIWWSRLFTDADFYQRYIDRWVELRRGAFSAATVNALLDALNTELTNEATIRDVARWAQTKRAWTSPFTGTVYPASQDAELQRLKDYLQQRANFFDSQWVAPVTLSHPGGNVAPGLSVTMTGPSGATIYYTLDGSDPRPSGGAAPSGGSVLTYSGAISVGATTRLRARAYHPTWTALTGANNPPLVSKWSGLREARYSTDAVATSGNLAVTEINFHPSDPSLSELAVNPVLDTSDFEFIEIKNIGPTAVDLGGLKLELAADFTLSSTQGITLAPGAFAILAANPEAFAIRYPGVPNVLGPFIGDLNNGGERVLLKNASGATIADFNYDDAWYPATDGLGRTLAVYNPAAPSAAFSTSANWRESAAIGGSPGADEPNRAPTVSAGADIVGYLPSAVLSGVVDDDAQPAATASVWSKLTGPGAVAFSNATAPVTMATFELPGSFSLRLAASDTVLSASDDVAVTMRDTPGAWLLRNPGIGTLNDDPDGDGRTNWFEWALGLSPMLGTGGDGTLAALDGGHLTLTYTRQKASPFVTYTVQATGDPAAWSDPLPGEITETILSDDGITQTIRATDNAPAGEKRFIRLRVTPP